MPLATPAQYAELLDAAKAARVVEACHQLGSAGRSLTGR
jgi:hypothetical protein